MKNVKAINVNNKNGTCWFGNGNGAGGASINTGSPAFGTNVIQKTKRKKIPSPFYLTK